MTNVKCFPVQTVDDCISAKELPLSSECHVVLVFGVVNVFSFGDLYEDGQCVS